jgi:hypothetical protein
MENDKMQINIFKTEYTDIFSENNIKEKKKFLKTFYNKLDSVYDKNNNKTDSFFRKEDDLIFLKVNLNTIKEFKMFLIDKNKIIKTFIEQIFEILQKSKEKILKLFENLNFENFSSINNLNLYKEENQIKKDLIEKKKFKINYLYEKFKDIFSKYMKDYIKKKEKEKLENKKKYLFKFIKKVLKLLFSNSSKTTKKEMIIISTFDKSTIEYKNLIQPLLQKNNIDKNKCLIIKNIFLNKYNDSNSNETQNNNNNIKIINIYSIVDFLSERLKIKKYNTTIFTDSDFIPQKEINFLQFIDKQSKIYKFIYIY